MIVSKLVLVFVIQPTIVSYKDKFNILKFNYMFITIGNTFIDIYERANGWYLIEIFLIIALENIAYILLTNKNEKNIYLPDLPTLICPRTAIRTRGTPPPPPPPPLLLFFSSDFISKV